MYRQAKDLGVPVREHGKILRAGDQLVSSTGSHYLCTSCNPTRVDFRDRSSNWLTYLS